MTCVISLKIKRSKYKLTHFFPMKTNYWMPLKMILFVLICISCRYSEHKNSLFEFGDIVFQDAPSGNSKAIKLITNSKYSHVGMIVKMNGKDYVYEAVQPVQIIPLEQWITRDKNNHFETKRLKNATSVFTPENIEKIKEQMNLHIGKNYDGAFRWSDNEMYCSEVIWKIYKNACNLEIGKTQVLEDLNTANPIVMKRLNEIYPQVIPWREKVISPQAIYESDLLTTISN